MNLWTMIVLIVAICVIGDIIKSRKNNQPNKFEKPREDISNLVYRLKKRIENLETIVLEKERNRRFAEMD